VLNKLLNYNLNSIKKLFLAYSFLASILIVGVLACFVVKTYDSFMEIKKLEMEYATAKVEIGFNGVVDYAESVVSHIGKQISLSNGSDQEIKEILNYFSKKNVGGSDLIKDSLSISMFSWANNKNFITINSEYGAIRFPYDVSERQYLQEAITEPWSMKIGTPVIGSVSGQQIIPAGMSVKSLKSRKLMGSILIGFSIDRLVYKLNKTVGNRSLDFVIVNKDGEILLESTPGIFSESDILLKKNAAVTKINKDFIVSKFSPLHPDENFLVIKANKKRPYFIIAGYQNSFIIRGLLAVFWPYVLAFFGLLLIFFNVWHSLKLRIISPIVQLSEVSKLVAQNLEYEVVMPESDVAEIIELTEQVKLIERYKINLLQAKKSQERFFANMSHELRTPLNGILNFSFMIKKEMFGPIDPTYKEMAEDIHESGSHLLNLVNDILDFSKMNISKIKLNQESFDIAEEVRTAMKIALSGSKIYDKKSEIKVVSEIDIQDKLFHGDRRMIKQILLNLLSNAYKFTEKGSIILKIFIDDKNNLILEVEDTGIGIKAVDLEKLVVEFGQVGDGSFRGKKQGSGLGLFLIKKMTELHQGSFKISSIYRQGTRVSISFPAERLVTKMGE
jgi:signal transduction histidine kinase